MLQTHRFQPDLTGLKNNGGIIERKLLDLDWRRFLPANEPLDGEHRWARILDSPRVARAQLRVRRMVAWLS